MRHQSVSTTEAYYIQLDAAAISDELCTAHARAVGTRPEGNISGNIALEVAHADALPS